MTSEPLGSKFWLRGADRTRGEFIYVLGRPGESLCKVGVSFEPERRAIHMQRETGRQMHVYFMCQSHVRPRLLERTVHAMLEKYRSPLGVEWFHCSPLRAALALEKVRQEFARPHKRKRAA